MTDFVELGRIYQGVNPNTGGKSTADDDFARFVEQRFYSMSLAKQPMREIWQGTHDLYYCNDWEWIVKGEGFDRPVRFPTLRDFTKTLVDEFMKDPPDIRLIPKNFDDPQAEDLIIGKKAYIDQRRNSIHEKKVRRQVFEDMFFYGKGFREVSYYDIDIDLDGTSTNIFNDVASLRLDPRHIFVDELATTLHDKLQINGARDAINRRIPALSTFQALAAKHPEWDQEACKRVKSENYFTAYGLDYIVTNSRETIEKTPTWVVRMYEYMNQECNIYGIVVGGVTIYQTTLYKAKGTTRIPIADYTFEPRNDSYWGNNLAQLIAGHIYLKDTVFNLDRMNFQLTAQPVVAVSGQFGYNPATHFLQPGGVWEAGSNMNGKLEDNIQPLISGNPNLKATEMLQRIDSELSITTHSDIRSMMYYPDKTATEVLRQNQMMNAHNEAIESISEIESEAIVYELFLEIMKTFMAAEDEEGNRRHVKIKGYMATNRTGQGPQFIAKAGEEDNFVLSEEMINADSDVEVVDSRAQKAQDIVQMGQILQAIPVIGEIIKINSDAILPKIDVVGLLGQLVEAVGLDPDRTFLDTGNIYDELEETQEEIMIGHNVEVPQDEDRKESLVRLKYFLDFMKQKQKDTKNPLKADQQKALQYHINATIQNIMENHLDKKRAQSQDAGNQPTPQANPSTAQGQAQAVQKDNQRQEQFSTPDTSAIKTAGGFGQRLQ